MKQTIILFVSIAIVSCSNHQRAQELYNQALSQYVEKNFSAAKTLCIQSLKEAKNPDALLLLSKIYFFTNDNDFEATVKKYISLAHSTQGYILYARWYIRKNESTKAQEQLTQALAHSPNDPAALYLLGTIYYSNQQYQDAIITFHKAFASYYYLMMIHKQLASLYTDIDLTQRAAKHQTMMKAILDFDTTYTTGE